MFKLCIKISNKNEKWEKSDEDLRIVEFLENTNKIFGEEITSSRSESLRSDKCDSCDLLENEVISLHETL